ncbi:MAG TPA: AI-2E family transporter [Elusimicrobiota bacterium]|nr:AI-2E family transporter [Elusimicrobiota bacterium]
MASHLSGPRKASYLLVVLALFVAARFGLAPALIGGLFASMVLDQSEQGLIAAGASKHVARWSSVALFVVVGLLLAVVFAEFVRIGVERLPTLLDRLAPRLTALGDRFGVDLPVGNVSELHAAVIDAIKQNAKSVETFSGLLTREFFQLLLAFAIAILRFVSDTSPETGKGRGLDGEIVKECRERASRFCASFELVMGAQIMISAIYTVLAAIFLIGFRIPFRTMLTLTTFVCGLVPIVGNLISNSLIVGAALTTSDNLAVAALVFLIVVHKGGYFLNSRIVGARMETPTWAILLGLLVGEALMGVTGIILAPTVIHYVFAELRAIPREAV